MCQETEIMNLGQIVPWVFALLTLIISFWNSRKSEKNALLNINKTVLSENRQNWINLVREIVSQYLSVHTMLDAASLDKDKYQELTRELYYLQVKLVLLLNPNEKDSKKLAEQTFKIAKLKDKRPEINVSEVKAEILVLTQKILKKEWERVKAIK